MNSLSKVALDSAAAAIEPAIHLNCKLLFYRYDGKYIANSIRSPPLFVELSYTPHVGVKPLNYIHFFCYVVIVTLQSHVGRNFESQPSISRILCFTLKFGKSGRQLTNSVCQPSKNL